MPLKFRCLCGTNLIVSKRYQGRAVRCPKCERRVKVPHLRPADEAAKPRPPAAEPGPGATKPPPVTGERFQPLSSLVDLPEPEPPPVQRPVKPPESAGPPTPAAAQRPPSPPPRLPAAAERVEPVAAATPAKAAPAAAAPAEAAPAAVEPAAGTVQEVARPGYQADAGKVVTVRQLAAALVLAALLSAVPAVLDVAEHIRSPSSAGVARWAYGLLLAAVLQLAYAVYLVQLPDWSSTWVVTVVTLAIATAYAMMLGLSFISHDGSRLVEWLNLADAIRGGKATGFCFIMLCITSLLSYFSGRISVRWQANFAAASRA